MLHVHGPTTAITAKILFDKVQIGELQDFTYSENYSVMPIDGLGSSNTILFLPGIFRGQASARKAYLEPDLFFHTLLPNLSEDGIKHFKQIGAPITTAYGGVLQNIELAKDVSSLATDIVNFLTVTNGKDNNKPSFVLSFDIEVYDSSDSVILKLEECVMDTRKLAISLSSVILFEDVTFRVRRRTK